MQQTGLLTEAIEVSQQRLPDAVTAIAVQFQPQGLPAKWLEQLRVLDWIEQTQLTGTGGHELQSWRYGEQLPTLSVQQNGEDCLFDNGHVMVIDMHNQVDELWQQQQGQHTSDDRIYPAVRFDCSQQRHYDFDQISDNYGVYTYSATNDAYYFANQVFDFFADQVGVIASGDKLRLRVHYGPISDSNAFWDGAYINLSDAYPLFYSTVSLDIVQ